MSTPQATALSALLDLHTCGRVQNPERIDTVDLMQINYQSKLTLDPEVALQEVQSIANAAQAPHAYISTSAK